MIGRMTSGTQPPLPLPQLAAQQLRMEMAAQKKSMGELAEALHLDRKAAKLRYDGAKAMTLTEVETLATWLDVDVDRLIRVAQAVA